MFQCPKNKFLASMINSRKLETVHFTFEHNGNTILLSNIEILETFFRNANKNQLAQTQQMLQQDKFSVKSINNFAYYFAKEYLIK